MNLIELMQQPQWTRDAACRNTKAEDVTNVMYPHAANHRGIAAAKAICAGCPVVRECLADAMSRRESDGVWGGLTAEERGDLHRAAVNRRRRKTAAQAADVRADAA